MRIVFGNDPGMDGGLACVRMGLSGAGGTPVNDMEVIPMFTRPHHRGDGKRELDPSAIHDWIRKQLPLLLPYNEYHGTVLAVLEDVHCVKGQGITSSFTFGQGFGALIAAYQILHVPIQFVTPQRWKKHVLAGTQKDKGAAIAFVQNMYPNVELNVGIRKVVYHDGMADAVCMMHYGLELLAHKQIAQQATHL